MKKLLLYQNKTGSTLRGKRRDIEARGKKGMRDPGKKEEVFEEGVE